MTQAFFEIDFNCHNYPDDYVTAKIVEIPEIDYLRYALPDKPDEVHTAKEFKALLGKIKFPRSSEIVIFVLNKNSGKQVALRFPLSWPDQVTPATRVHRLGTTFMVPE